MTTGNLFASPAPGRLRQGRQARRPVSCAAQDLRPRRRERERGRGRDEDQSAKRRKTAPAQRASLADLLPKPKADAALGAGRASGEGGGATIDLGDAAGPGPSPPPPQQTRRLRCGLRVAPVADVRRGRVGAYAHAAVPVPAAPPHPEDPGSNLARRARARPDSTWTPRLRRRWRRAREGRDGRGGARDDPTRSRGAAPVDASSATGLAFGDEYRDKLQREAGAKPSATHKAKNQIGSLLYNAKQAELKIMEGRLQGVSHKAMTKQKYGW